MSALLQRLFRSGAGGLGGIGARGIGYGRSAPGMLTAAAEYAAGGAIGLGKAARWASRSPMRARVGAGALAGAAYGAMSDDTSMIGGALMGAGIGRGSMTVSRGIRAYGKFGAMGMGRGRAASATMRMIGGSAKRYIGSSYSRASNAFQGMRGRSMRGALWSI